MLKKKNHPIKNSSKAMNKKMLNLIHGKINAI